MSLRICILETDILRPELIERYEGYGRMFQQLFAKQPIAAEFVIYNVVEGRYPADDERFDAYLVTGSKADSFGPDPWIQTLKTFLLDRYERGDKRGPPGHRRRRMDDAFRRAPADRRLSRLRAMRAPPASRGWRRFRFRPGSRG